MILFFAVCSYGGDFDKDLINAVKENDERALNAALAAKANPNARDSLGNSALLIAVGNGNDNMAGKLIQNGASASGSYTRGMSVLMLAVNKQMINTAGLLIKHGADATVKLDNGTNVLMMACERGLESVVGDIIATKQVDINARTTEGLTALSIAIKNGYLSIAKKLHCEGAKPSNLLEAALLSDTNAAEDLIKRGENTEIKDKDGKTPLLIAYESENYAMASFLLSKGADINARDNYGLTPVISAARSNNGALMSLAIDSKADIMAKDINGITPLMYTIFSSNEDAVEELLRYNPQAANSIDNNAATPLVIAVSRGNGRAAQKLIMSGAHINSNKSRRALNVAIGSGNLAIAQLLLDKGARVNARDISGTAPIITAASRNDAEAVKFLIRNGARANIKDSSGLTAMDYAKRYDNREIVEMLAER